MQLTNKPLLETLMTVGVGAVGVGAVGIGGVGAAVVGLIGAVAACSNPAPPPNLPFPEFEPAESLELKSARSSIVQQQQAPIQPLGAPDTVDASCGNQAPADGSDGSDGLLPDAAAVDG